MTKYLEFADFLLIAEAVLGVRAELIANFDRSAVEFVERNGRTWVAAPGDPGETDDVIRRVASGSISDADFRDWIGQRCG